MIQRVWEHHLSQGCWEEWDCRHKGSVHSSTIVTAWGWEKLHLSWGFSSGCLRTFWRRTLAKVIIFSLAVISLRASALCSSYLGSEGRPPRERPPHCRTSGYVNMLSSIREAGVQKQDYQQKTNSIYLFIFMICHKQSSISMEIKVNGSSHSKSPVSFPISITMQWWFVCKFYMQTRGNKL